MRNMKSLVVAIGALALLVSGCDSDDGDTNGTPDVVADTADAGGDEGGDDTTGDDTTGDDTTGDVDEDTTTAANFCTNEADLAIIQGGEKDPTGAAGTCGQGCYFGAADPDDLEAIRTCTIGCITGPAPDGQDVPLTGDCAGCYGDAVVCAIVNCLDKGCLDPSSQACITCREEQGCTPNFFVCSGLPQN